MRREQLEHVIRAAATIADDTDVVVLGSQSVLAQYPDAPAALLESVEADVYPRNRPDRSDLVDGSIGENSPFHQTFGYYAQGVDESTATLPAGWQDRLHPICNENTAGATGWCLDFHDPLVAKLVAGREKDIDYATAAAANAMVDSTLLRERLAATPLDAATRVVVEGRCARVLDASKAS